MVDNPNEPSNFAQASQEFTTMLVSSILKRHGFKKENVKSISDEELKHLKNLVENLRTQLENLTKPVDVPSEAPTAPDKRRRKRVK